VAAQRRGAGPGRAITFWGKRTSSEQGSLEQVQGKEMREGEQGGDACQG